MKNRFFIASDRFAFVVLPLILGCISFLGANPHMYKERGSIALLLLIIILFMKPLIVIAGYSLGHILLPYRRQLGVAAFWFAAFHGIGLALAKNITSVQRYVQNPFGNFLFMGASALIGMFLLAVTSNFFAIKILGKQWKKVQWLAYPVLFLGKLHADLSHAARMKGLMAAGDSVRYIPYLPTLIVLIIFLTLKYRQHKVATKQRKTVQQFLATSQS